MIDARAIKEKGRELGIDIKITQAESFIPEKERIKSQVKQGLFINPRWFSGSELDRFCNPKTILASAKSIISSFLFYLTKEEPNPSKSGEPYGFVANYTQRNYYKELKKRLKRLGQFIKKEYNAKFAIHSCGPIAEKPIAQRSGTGYYGKHSIIIHPKYGSWIVLGEIITDLEFEVDKPLDKSCGECSRCIDACPTKAIIAPYIIDRKKCIQALSNSGGIISEEIAGVWEDRVYGCTTCQDVCPINKKVQAEPPKTEIGIVGAYLPLIELLQMDEPTYRKKYAHNQISARWIDFDTIKRNALIALGNIKDKKTIPIIKKFTMVAHPVLKDTARWALSQF